MSERKVPLAIAAVMGCLSLAGHPVYAQVHLGTIPVGAERPQASGSASVAPAPDDAPFVTVVDATDPKARVTSVAELLEGQAGVRVRSRGGLGAFTSLSIRGADSGQVAVYLDGVPLNRALGSAVDLAQLPVEGLERVEIYRGVPPIELGADAIGGAIHLVSRRGARRRGASWRAAVGGGSFGARSASLGYSRTEMGVTVDLSAAYHGARGDFRYYDNQGTLLDRGDDLFSRRRNAGFDQVALDATVQGTGPWRWNLGSHGFFKRQGVPGPGTAGAESRTARLGTGRLVLEGGVALPRSHKGIDARADAHILVERVGFDNLGEERVGTYSPSRTEGQTVAFGIEPRIDASMGSHQLLSVYGELRVERYQANDLLAPPRERPVSLRTRVAVAAVDEWRFLGDRLALAPALRFDGIDSQLAEGVGVRGPQAEGASRTEVFLSPRLGARWRAVEDLWGLRGLWIKGNVGRFVRLPSLIELFGDNAFILPRPAVRPEVAVGGDVGLGLMLGARRAQRGLGAMLEAAFFGRRVADTIVLLPSGRALAARNLGPSTVLGAELRAEVHWGRAVMFTVDYTFLDTRNRTEEPGVEGRQLPGRARHELSARLNLARGPVAGFYEVNFLDRVFRDPQNFNAIPARWLHAVGITLGPFARWPLTLGVEARNLFDLRVVDLPLGGSANAGRTTPYPLVDFFDYPLPGRAIYATLALRR
jgi:outer membrane cobalamin receptor